MSEQKFKIPPEADKFIHMNLSWFISKKYIFKKRFTVYQFHLCDFHNGYFTWVATLIIALSVLNGFEKTLTDKIIDFDSHIKITSFRSILPDYKSTLPLLENYLTAFDPTIIPFASKLAIISSKKSKEGINLIGIKSDSPKPGS